MAPNIIRLASSVEGKLDEILDIVNEKETVRVELLIRELISAANDVEKIKLCAQKSPN
tara:strand:+ start:651 stop:824 length:174 start_codon:yes stop_codon:yes gene_type:complete